jgi:outer membrane lipoprotein-sorting protein
MGIKINKIFIAFIFSGVLSLGSFAFAGPPGSPSSPSSIEEIKALQKDISSIKADFSQKKVTELLDRPIKSTGMFYFKSGFGVRWEYDEVMNVIYDGKTLYLHYLGLDEAEKVSGVSGYVGPLSFDIEALLKDYDVTATDISSGVSLSLIPRKHMPFKSMSMVFKKGSPFPDKVRILEESGDHTTINFSNLSTNIELSDGLFIFKVPPGVTLRERSIR